MKSNPSSQDQDIIEILKDLASHKVPYPPELLEARRAAFVNQVAQRSQVEIEEGLTAKNQEVVQTLQNLKAVEAEYPAKLLTARRSAFRRQIVKANRTSVLQALRSVIQSWFVYQPKTSWMSSMRLMRTSLIIAGVAIAAFAGFLIYGNRGQLSNLSPSQNGISQPGSVLATATPEAKIICKPGLQPPLCLAKEFDKTRDLTYVGNGSARPAVAKDTNPADGGIYRAAYINDGLYGPGASWVSNSPNSWIKIDLGKTTTINTVTFGRDRLGTLNDRNPGQFVISVALSDNVYANGNSSNDSLEYSPVFDSEQAGFSGVIPGPQTVTAQFDSLAARFVKITFENPGTAVDEVEVFMLSTPPLSSNPTKTKEGDGRFKTATPLPTSSPRPTETLTPVPPNTPVPTDTPTPVPSDTPVPTDTPTPVPTDTPLPPPDTDTPLPVPTDTLIPFDTPIPTETPIFFVHVDTIRLTAV